ncbi:MAG: FAD-binding protein [Chloroflexi bacterium]|nr:FAD-binding protein [Chloroflexota bacterium]
MSNESDLIIVGSGVAGLTAALAAAERGADTLVLTAGPLLSGSSRWAQGGIAAAVGEGDSPILHAADTVAVGGGLNDREAVDLLVREGRGAVLKLVKSGVPFEGNAEGPDLGLEAGHSRRRVLHARGGATGAMLSETLLAQASRNARITLLPDTPVSKLLTSGGRVSGVVSGDSTFRGRAVILATGGYAKLWGRSTNPASNVGSGLYLAWQAGASLADLEFVQFHPTALDYPGVPAYLLSEALRGEGALLVDSNEAEIVNPLLSRDIVARAIACHLSNMGPVYLSLRHLDPSVIRREFSAIAGQLQQWGLDLARDLLPIAPAAHYCMGGVRTDTEGRTDVPGLYAAGEVACTGAQGANRLASNSLLECLVFGRRAANAALADKSSAKAEWSTQALPDAGIRTEASRVRQGHYTPGGLGARLDRDLGVLRDRDKLEELVASLPCPSASAAPPDHVIASLAARSALLREESRGAHYRMDHSVLSLVWQGRILWRRDSCGAMSPQFEEVSR